MNQVIRNGRLVDPGRGLDQRSAVWIADGSIAGVGDEPEDFGSAAVDTDATGCWIIPGLTDLCARVAGDIGAESRAAAAGGFTRLCCPPDTDPILDSVAVLRHLLTSAQKDGHARVMAIGALTAGLNGAGLADHHTLLGGGCVALGNGAQTVADSNVLRSALRTARSLGSRVFLRPEDQFLASGCVHDGPVATRLGLEGIPASAEAAGLARDLALVEDTGAQVHFCRLSTARGVDLLESARSRGLPVTADVAMHQLFLTEHDVSGFDSNCHTRPPLRSTADRDALIDAVQHGVIDAICSDHTPLNIDAKLAPFADTEPGISSLETTLALGMRLVDDDRLSLQRLLTALIDAPSKILGLGLAGISIGSAADLVIYDPDAVWRCDPDMFLSAGHNSPFAGWEFHGRVRETYLAGLQTFSMDGSA